MGINLSENILCIFIFFSICQFWRRGSRTGPSVWRGQWVCVETLWSQVTYSIFKKFSLQPQTWTNTLFPQSEMKKKVSEPLVSMPSSEVLTSLSVYKSDCGNFRGIVVRLHPVCLCSKQQNALLTESMFFVPLMWTPCGSWKIEFIKKQTVLRGRQVNI